MNLVDQHRDEIDLLVKDLPKGDADGRIFDAPWQARVFALIVALVKQGHLPWKTFQSRLVDEISSGRVADTQAPLSVERQYYEHWLVAAEKTLKEIGNLGDHDLDQMIVELRRASEQIRNMQKKQRTDRP